MVTHFYESSTGSPDTQHIRLIPARAITDTQIPCLVWAPSFAHYVPTAPFTLQMLVPDKELNAACSAVTSLLSYMRIRKMLKIGSSTGSMTAVGLVLPQLSLPRVQT